MGDRQSDKYWRDLARQALEHGTREQAELAVADLLQETIGNESPELYGVYADLIGFAMSRVNWLEVARAQFHERMSSRTAAESEDAMIVRGATIEAVIMINEETGEPVSVELPPVPELCSRPIVVWDNEGRPDTYKLMDRLYYELRLADEKRWAHHV